MAGSNFEALKDLKHVHIVGVGGTLMGAFAAFLKRRGIKVTGSDEKIYPPMSHVLAEAGVETFEGYRGENLPHSSSGTLVVIGNVIRKDNPEAMAVVESGIPYTSLPEFMERYLLQNTTNILASGTHGKTTTSSMMAFVLRSCKKDPSYFIGGVSLDLPHSFVVSQSGSSLFVLEGDEYDTAYWDKVPKFNHYCPDHVVLTSVEFDHADIYPSLDHVKAAFRGLIERIRVGGVLIGCVDYPHLGPLVEFAKTRELKSVLTYGTENNRLATYFPRILKSEGSQTRFEILKRDGQGQSKSLASDVVIQMSGEHNVLNALAVWIECVEVLGIPASEVEQGLAGFQGVKRRLELRGEPSQRKVIDDFAHHPTAVRETLKAIKRRYPGQRILAVFEPRSATSRRAVFQTEYANAFDLADLIYLSAPYDQSRIPESDRFSTERLQTDMKSRGRTVEVFQNVEAGVESVAQSSREGDVIVVMSNGGFGGFIPKLLDRLR